MLPQDFKEKNKIYTAPASMPDCLPLPAYQDEEQIISFWELDDDEKTALIVFGRVWIGIHAQVQPPVWISTLPPFREEIINQDMESAVNRYKASVSEKIEAFEAHCFAEGIDYYLDGEYTLKDLIEQFVLFCFGGKDLEEKEDEQT